MRVYLLGAGASKAYSESPTGQRMPIARDFFETFHELSISQNPWVLLEGLIGYLEHEKGVPSAYEYLSSGIDIEALHSEIEVERNRRFAESRDTLHSYYSYRAYNELVFLFASVLNEIQNGPISEAHMRLAKSLAPEDAVITFNWDTLADRALAATTAWRPDWGYAVIPNEVFEDQWRAPIGRDPEVAAPKLIKLHGSTNWLTAHSIRDQETGKIRLTHELDPSAFNVFVASTGPYDCFAGRYLGGYQPYSYGYYPPNLNFPAMAAPPGYKILLLRPKLPWKPEGEAGSGGLTSMPLIIPPVRNKSYDLFGDLFRALWRTAEDLLAAADEIVIVGYSFPPTDSQSDRLFRSAFLRRTTTPRVLVLDPMPDRAASKFRDDFGIRESRLEIRQEFFSAQTKL
jgi:hypothetical protein